MLSHGKTVERCFGLSTEFGISTFTGRKGQCCKCSEREKDMLGHRIVFFPFSI